MKKHLYLSITGTMGSGKTTAAKLLSQKLKFRLIEENFGENAFLPRFYKEMQRWAFHSQTFFLMEKITQTLQTNVILNSFQYPKQKKKTTSVKDGCDKILKQVQDDNKKGVIQDTPIYQDVFSYAKALHIMGNMDDAEWRLYQKIYRSFAPYLPRPDYIIYLKTSQETIKKRIASRDRNYEKEIPDGYLELLEMLNESWMKKEADGIKIITIDTDELNLVRNQKNKRDFGKQIRNYLK